MQHEFRNGDLVVLKGCHAPQIVEACNRHSLKTHYRSDHLKRAKWRDASDFEFYYPDTTPQSEKDQTMPKLYQTNADTPVYGTLLTKDSKGNYVLEMKDGSGVKAFPAEDLTEVKPFTVQIDGRHFVTTKDRFRKGDVLIAPTGRLVVVEDVDTNASKAEDVSFSDWRRVVTEEIAA